MQQVIFMMERDAVQSEAANKSAFSMQQMSALTKLILRHSEVGYTSNDPKSWG